MFVAGPAFTGGRKAGELMTRQIGVRHQRNFGAREKLSLRARAVLRIFIETRRLAKAFVLSCGLLPEVSEAGSERLFQIVHDIAARYLDGGRHTRALRTALRRAKLSTRALDEVDRHLIALQFSEVTAAYVFGLSVGLTIGSLPPE
jgi:hypothetical protein